MERVLYPMDGLSRRPSCFGAPPSMSAYPGGGPSSPVSLINTSLPVVRVCLFFLGLDADAPVGGGGGGGGQGGSQRCDMDVS